MRQSDDFNIFSRSKRSGQANIELTKPTQTDGATRLCSENLRVAQGLMSRESRGAPTLKHQPHDFIDVESSCYTSSARDCRKE